MRRVPISWSQTLSTLWSSSSTSPSPSSTCSTPSAGAHRIQSLWRRGRRTCPWSLRRSLPQVIMVMMMAVETFKNQPFPIQEKSQRVEERKRRQFDQTSFPVIISHHFLIWLFYQWITWSAKTSLTVNRVDYRTPQFQNPRKFPINGSQQPRSDEKRNYKKWLFCGCGWRSANEIYFFFFFYKSFAWRPESLQFIDPAYFCSNGHPDRKKNQW